MRFKVKTWVWRLLALVIFVGPVGCSDVAFKSGINEVCQQYQRDFGGTDCGVDSNGLTSFHYSINVGVVDLLFVNDNSTSMYPEQSEMALRFPGFLDSISRLDYRLAMITTDWTKNPGGFLTFPNGQKSLANSSRVIDATHTSNIAQFQSTIKREETAKCEASGFTDASCPTGDERGIYNLNKALERADQRSFFRPGGHLAVIILSDEDERSNSGGFTGYPLEDLDKPLTFVKNTKAYLGETKTVSVHSIIIRPNDTNCFNAQNRQAGVKGFYGHLYSQLSLPNNELMAAGNIIAGGTGSICSNNYTTELGDIATKINQTLKTIQLPCRPDQDVVDVTFDPVPSSQIYYTVDADKRLQLSPAAPAGTKVSLSYKCRI